MAALQEVGAVFGLAELAFRSISSLYEFLSSLKNCPKEVEKIRKEIETLSSSLIALKALITASPETLGTVLSRSGLEDAINDCGEACVKTHEALADWTKAGSEAIASRLRVRWHRESILGLISDISRTKQTTILAISVAQLEMANRQSNTSQYRMPSARPVGDSRVQNAFAGRQSNMMQYGVGNIRPRADGQQAPPTTPDVYQVARVIRGAGVSCASWEAYSNERQQQGDNSAEGRRSQEQAQEQQQRWQTLESNALRQMERLKQEFDYTYVEGNSGVANVALNGERIGTGGAEQKYGALIAKNGATINAGIT